MEDCPCLYPEFRRLNHHAIEEHLLILGANGAGRVR